MVRRRRTARDAAGCWLIGGGVARPTNGAGYRPRASSEERGLIAENPEHSHGKPAATAFPP